jgi:hypothetical protein
MTETWAEVKGVEREYWKPATKGEERIGTLLRAEAGEYKDKATMQYVLDVDGKDVYTPNHAILNKKLLAVKAGCKVKIIYQGTGEKKKKGKNAAEMYDVFVSDAPRQQGLSEEPKKDNPLLDPSAKVIVAMKKADGWDNNSFSQLVLDAVGNDIGESLKAIDKLKKEGKIIQTNNIWRAT